jgi:tetratricopeptide (TPR) repeat protein
MNRQQFINYVKNPAELNASSLPQLQNLVKEYPFFQTAETLLALNFFVENHIKFNEHLKIAAAYAPDRKILRLQINNLRIQKQSEIYRQKNEAVAPVEEPVKIAETKAISHESNLSELISQLKNEVDLYMIQASDPNSKKQIAKLQTLTGKLEEIIGTQIKPAKSTTKKKESGRFAAGEYSLDHLEELPAEKPKQLSNADLIEKFIREEPKIVPKPTFFDPVDVAKHSLLDNESVVSETLAEIYYKQGNLTKAIKIYKKLSLVNPQKSSYFAAQIEKIQKEIK